MNPERSNIGSRLLTGIGIGAALMYFLDPDRGNRRRHLVGDKARRALRLGRRELHDAIENTKNHAVGTVAEVKGRLNEEVVDDDRLVENQLMPSQAENPQAAG